MNVIAIVVYNRLDNIKHWLHCWAQCEQTAQLVIVHNSEGETWDLPGVTYIKRKWGGYDIGAFQDVCRNRLPGFPEYEKLLWITDDTFPMGKDFANKFFSQLKDNVGCVAMCVSPYVRQHIRTTGFAITKQVANRLTFPADPVTTKEHCYQFEHRSKDHLLAQVQRMNLRAMQVAPNERSPLYDTGYGRRIKSREAEHYKIFGDVPAQSLPVHSQVIYGLKENYVIPTKPLVVFICPIYDKYPQIISSLICQTYSNWQLHLVHDGPNELDLPDDPRIIYTKVERKGNDWGHTIRKEWINKVEGDYLVITNADNFHVPVFIEYLLKGFHNGTVATYCDAMVHSYKAWQVIPCRKERGYIDCAGVMVKMQAAKAVGWNSLDHSADWFYFKDIMDKYGSSNFVPVRGCLLTHN